MQSIKPGRAPSAINSMMAVFAIVFGIFWTVSASGMGAPIAPLGIVFILVGVVILLFSLKNTFGRNRFSVMDITRDGEEPDPFSARLGYERDTGSDDRADSTETQFCPYCGAPADRDFEFCKVCGRRLP